APCHQDSATIALLHAQVKAAAKQGIRVVPVVCSGLRESGELLMLELALLTNGTSFFLTDDSGIGDTHLKPTTDSLKVEHLNDMLVRTIIEFSRMPQCQPQWADSALAPTDEEAFLPNPFDPEDLDTIPQTAPVRPLDEVLTVRPNPCDDFFLADLPLGADALFLVDLTGKTLQNLGPQRAESLTVNVGAYPTGIYFLKAFVGGNWYTRKIIVR
ncbi:MAG: T9SS type A sorting domain-containing protein, partial [Paludibacteraceae bacterium]|nr:T9SS type A sorting domain-containing protein [Paludibacteraceae bacterium]